MPKWHIAMCHKGRICSIVSTSDSIIFNLKMFEPASFLSQCPLIFHHTGNTRNVIPDDNDSFVMTKILSGDNID